MDILFGRSQLPVILSFFACGIASGVISDFFCIKRRYFKENRTIIFFDDFLFMIINAVIVIFNAYSFNDGNMKWYEIPVMFFGFIIYKKTVSRLFIKAVCHIIGLIIKFVKLIFVPVKITFEFISREKEKFKFFAYTARKRRSIAKAGL